MQLQNKYYEFIRTGTKRIELRLFDEKRQKIQLGNEIVFMNNSDDSERIHVRVIGLLRYKSFEELFSDFDIDILADRSMTKEELMSDLSEFYPIEKQEKYGVLGIRFELVEVWS